MPSHSNAADWRDQLVRRAGSRDQIGRPCILAVYVQQGIAFLQAGCHDFTDEDTVRAPGVFLHKLAVERDQMIVENRRASFQTGPGCGGKPVVPAVSDKDIGDVGLIITQEMHAEATVPGNCVAGTARLVDTDQKDRVVGRH